MRLKLTAELKLATNKVLEAQRELARVDAAILKARDSEPALRDALTGARKRLADAEVSVELDGATPDLSAMTAVHEAAEAIDRASGKLAALETRRAESAARLKGLSEGFETARAAFLAVSRQAIEAEFLIPAAAQLRAGYLLACALDQACCIPSTLEFTLEPLQLPSVEDPTRLILRFDDARRRDGQWISAHNCDRQALELTATLADVSAAANVLKGAA